VSIVDEIRANLPRYESFRETFAAWDSGAIDEDALDTALWMLACRVVYGDERAGQLPDPVIHYYASRLMEWEVGNGGFSQAAYNIPEWFEPAAQGYEAIGHSPAAQLIREAGVIARKERGLFGRLRRIGADIGSVFAAFKASSLDGLASDLDDIGWWAMSDRLKYVLNHREAFLSVDSNALQWDPTV
jgi:Domain of unknown function (DUF4375)